MDLNTDQMLDLYKFYREEMNENSKALNSRLSWLSGLFTVLLGGIIAGTFQATTSIHFGVLLMGPAAAFLLADIGIKALGRLYRAYLESITMAGKLEQLLKLTDPLTSMSYWNGDSLVPSRWQSSRETFSSSDEWVDFRNDKGLMRWAKRLLRGVQAISVVLFTLLLFSFISQLRNPTSIDVAELNNSPVTDIALHVVKLNSE